MNHQHTNFRTLNTAVTFYKMASKLKVRGDAKNQLDRASRSIVLNLAEGSGKRTAKDQKRFFYIAMGSLRECQALLLLENLNETTANQVLDSIGAQLYRLIQNTK